MKALIVYDSTYGNTEQIARAVARGLAEHENVNLLPVARVNEANLNHFDLLVVGGPTHAHGMSDPLKKWLDNLPTDTLRGKIGAAFDTRYDKPRWLTGSAADGIAKRLKKLGAEVFLPPESFYILHGEGPLADGELERAERWASLTPAGVEEAVQ